MKILNRKIKGFTDGEKPLDYAVYIGDSDHIEGMRFEVRVKDGDLEITATRERDLTGLDKQFWLNWIRDGIVDDLNRYNSCDSLIIPGCPGCPASTEFLV